MLQVADAPTSAPVVPGVDRVLWLTVRLHDDSRRCDGVVHGVRHHRPVDVTVGLDVVHRLLLAGVPAVGVEA